MLLFVTVKAQLVGHPFDLEALAAMLPSGDTRVLKENDDYYLGWTGFSSSALAAEASF